MQRRNYISNTGTSLRHSFTSSQVAASILGMELTRVAIVAGIFRILIIILKQESRQHWERWESALD